MNNLRGVLFYGTYLSVNPLTVAYKQLLVVCIFRSAWSLEISQPIITFDFLGFSDSLVSALVLVPLEFLVSWASWVLAP